MATITAKQFTRYAADPAAFRDSLTVDVDGTPRVFGDVMDGWQRDDFARLDPALMVCNGRKQVSEGDGDVEPVKMRAYLERPRGHSKTTDLAVTCIWALAFASRPLHGYAFAADQDQANLLLQAMATLIRWNPWLGAILDVQKHLVVNKARGHPGAGGQLEIFTSDVASSYGILPDLVIADELCHWQGDGSLWHSIISSAAKRSNCFLCVISNAGFVDSWQWEVREAARLDPDNWIFSRLDGPQASWLTPNRLAALRKQLPATAYARLIDNQWSNSGGDALSPQDIAACFYGTVSPMTYREPGWLFVAGVDLGLTRDGSCVVVLAIPADGRGGRLRLAHHKLWRPTLGKKLNIAEVEQHILDMDATFDLEFVGFDPWQAEHLAQRLEVLGERRRRVTEIYKPFRQRGAAPWMRAINPTATNLRLQATLMIEAVQDHRLILFPCPQLYRDLLKLRAVEKSYGIRLESPRDGEGHGDSYSALANALVIGHELAGKKPILAGPIQVGAVQGPSRLEQAWADMDGEAAHTQRVAEMHASENQHSLRNAVPGSVRFSGQ